MPKSRSNSKSKRKRRPSAGASPQYGGRYPKAKRRRDYIIVGVVGIMAVAAIAAYLWWRTATAQGFLALAATGDASLEKVETEFSRGRTHLRPGQRTSYDSRFPLSGTHHGVPTKPGFYDVSQPPAQLVHAMEHGRVAIYYGRPGEAELDTLKSWADLYPGGWDGIVVTPMPGLRQKIVLTAWVRRLTLDSFDAAAVAAFIDAYRGRGPENPVR